MAGSPPIREALAAADDWQLEKAFARNIFEGSSVDARMARLARHVRAAAHRLDAAEEDNSSQADLPQS